MATTTYRARLDSKGRITLPVEIRERLGLRPGTQLVIELHGKAIILRKQGRIKARDLLGLAGKYRVNLEELEHGLGEEL